MLHTSRFASRCSSPVRLRWPALPARRTPRPARRARPPKPRPRPARPQRPPRRPRRPRPSRWCRRRPQAEEAALASADADQLSAAERVHYGEYVCDDKFKVHVERNTTHPGYVSVRYLKDTWVMKPVGSVTGAVRLEDTRGQVLLEIPDSDQVDAAPTPRPGSA